MNIYTSNGGFLHATHCYCGELNKQTGLTKLSMPISLQHIIILIWQAAWWCSGWTHDQQLILSYAGQRKGWHLQHFSSKYSSISASEDARLTPLPTMTQALAVYKYSSILHCLTFAHVNPFTMLEEISKIVRCIIGHYEAWRHVIRAWVYTNLYI